MTSYALSHPSTQLHAASVQDLDRYVSLLDQRNQQLAAACVSTMPADTEIVDTALQTLLDVLSSNLGAANRAASAQVSQLTWPDRAALPLLTPSLHS